MGQEGAPLKTIGNQGRALWLEWSQTSEKYDPKAASRAWASFAPGSTDYRAVFAEAQRAGWRNPMRTATPVVGRSVLREEGRKHAAAVDLTSRNGLCKSLKEILRDSPENELAHESELFFHESPGVVVGEIDRRVIGASHCGNQRILETQTEARNLRALAAG